MQVGRSTAPTRCTYNGESSELRIETRFPVGTLTDKRVLVSRTAFAQTLTFSPSVGEGGGGGGAAAAATVCRRYFTRIESEEERASAEAAESSARETLAHQAATMSLLSGGERSRLELALLGSLPSLPLGLFPFPPPTHNPLPHPRRTLVARVARRVARLDGALCGEVTLNTVVVVVGGWVGQRA